MLWCEGVLYCVGAVGEVVSTVEGVCCCCCSAMVGVCVLAGCSGAMVHLGCMVADGVWVVCVGVGWCDYSSDWECMLWSHGAGVLYGGSWCF